MSTTARPLRIAFVSLAVAAALLARGAYAGVPTPHNAGVEPLHLVPEPGWLDADTDAAAKLDDVAAPTMRRATRAEIVAAARDALRTGAAKSGVDAFDDVQARVHAARYGAYVVQTRETYDGVEVFGARRGVLLDASLAVRAVTGSTAARPPSPDARTFRIDEVTALRYAAGTLDGLLAASALRKASTVSALAHYAIDPSPGFVPSADVRIKRVWYPSASGLLPAWYAEFVGRSPGSERPVARAVVVAADDGRHLYSRDLVNDHQPYTYRVFATPHGRPYVDPYGFTNPHPTGMPDGSRPTVPAPMNLVTLVHGGISTGDPWLPDGATETVGNNVDAFFDSYILDENGICTFETGGDTFDPANGDVRTTTNGPRRFDYAFDATATATDYIQCLDDVDPAPPVPVGSPQFNAKLVQAFYTVNWLHDLFYDLGFDEAAANMQTDNYGRGGVGGDPLNVFAAVLGTFAFVTPEDGGVAGLSLGINNYSRSRRDVGMLDLGIVAHEWAHTMVGRLTSLQYTGQQGSLNEGTADFVGLLLTVRAQDRPFGGAYAVGAYMNLDYRFRNVPPEPVDNSYYHGIRRFPHSVDRDVNPLTFRRIGMDHPLPPGGNGFDWKLRSITNAEIHTAGEIWTAALWECSSRLLAAAPPHRFDETRDRFLANLVAALKLFPAEATFTEARDALLFAIRADSETDYRRCRAGFAARGLGAGAIAPARYDVAMRGTIESFDDAERALGIVDVTLDDAATGDADGVLDRGETGRLAVTIKNTGFSPTSSAQVRVQPRPGVYTLLGDDRVDDIALAPGESRTVTFDVRLRDHRRVDAATFPIVARDQRRPSVRAERDATFAVDYDLVRDATVDTAASDIAFAANWTSSFGVGDYPDFCFLSCATHWTRSRHRGENAALIGHPRVLFDALLTGHPFLVATGAPLRVRVRHDYDFDRRADDPTTSPGYGSLEISIDGGDWQTAGPYLASDTATFSGVSNGWRSDVLDFGTSLAGRRVQLRWLARAMWGFYDDPAFWALARVEILGSAEPMFVAARPE